METHNGVIRFSPPIIKFALSSTEYFPGTLPVGCSSQGLCLKQPQEDLFSRISYMTARIYNVSFIIHIKSSDKFMSYFLTIR